MTTDTTSSPSKALPQQTPEQAALLHRIAEQQGTLHTSNIEHLWGSGNDLWSDEEFAAFLEHNRRSRASRRTAS